MKVLRRTSLTLLFLLLSAGPLPGGPVIGGSIMGNQHRSPNRNPVTPPPNEEVLPPQPPPQPPPPPPQSRPRGLETNGVPGPLVYYWASAEGSGQQELFLSGQKIGLYDPRTGVFRRVNSDGSVSEPVAPPWRRSAQPGEAEAASDRARPAEAQAEARESAAGPLPLWLPHAVGGTTFVVVTGLGLLWQRQRHQRA
jgi:hypothetical protein